jgi:hypothetical protein
MEPSLSVVSSKGGEKKQFSFLINRMRVKMKLATFLLLITLCKQSEFIL